MEMRFSVRVTRGSLIGGWSLFSTCNNPVQSGVGEIFNIVIPILITCLSLSLYSRYFLFTFDAAEKAVV